MNRVILVGRLVADPEMRATPQGVSVCNMRLAVAKRSDREQSYFYDISAWRGLADICGRYLIKGQRVAVIGELQTRDYTDKAGTKRQAVYVNADDVEMLDRPRGSEQASVSGTHTQAAPPELAGFDDINEDELPF